MLIKFIKSFKYDLTFFLSPLIFVIAFTFIVKAYFPESLTIKNDPLWLFLFIILFDVAHVWGTLYMVYFNKKTFNKHKKLYIFTPLLTFLFTFGLMFIENTGTLLFFFIGFFAVYHFIKQQIGFILVYAHKEENTKSLDKKMDSLIGWTITLFPMLYWFSNLDTRNYIWFFDGEFIKLPNELFPLLWFVFIILVLIYVLYEFFRIFTGKKVNLLKYIYIFITFFIWFNGIVWNNSLLIFAFGNVLLHGLNYFGIVYLSTKNKLKSGNYVTFKFIKKVISYSIVSFVFLLLFIATIEEYLWDQFFRNERGDLWGTTFYGIGEHLNIFIYAGIIGLLALPQLTHYFLDAYIWKKEFKPEI